MRMWVGAALAGAMMAAPVNAATFYDWSFYGDFGSRPGPSSGTIFSPAWEDFTGSTATVDDSSVENAPGSGYIFDPSSSSYTFSNGTLDGSLYFERADGAILNLGGGGSVSQIYATDDGGRVRSSVTFTPATISAVSAGPEPASWAMMIVGFGMAGGALRRQRKLRATSVKASFA